MAVPMRSTDFRSIVEPILNETFDGIYTQRADEWKGVFKERTGTPRSYHEEPVLFGFNAAPEMPDGTPVTFDAGGVLFIQRYVYKVFGLAFALTKVLVEDGEPELRRMKPSAYLVNASRGPVIDEKALVRALQQNWIAGAGLDVYENEPAMADGLAELDNVVLLPHIASASLDTRGKMATMAATNALAHLKGEPAPNVVNPEVYESDAYRARISRG